MRKHFDRLLESIVVALLMYPSYLWLNWFTDGRLQELVSDEEGKFILLYMITLAFMHLGGFIRELLCGFFNLIRR